MRDATALPKLTPLLVVQDAAKAIDFYVDALGAREVVRYINRANGTISHADLAVGQARFSVTEEARAFNSDAPPSLGGSPVVLQLQVEDVAAAVEKMLHAGAAAIFPLMDFCGERMARLRDPFGHVWILSQRIEELTPDEIQRRRDAFMEQMMAKGVLPAHVPPRS
jgi:PhnB protein